MAEAVYGLTHIKMAPATEKDLSGYYQCSSTTTGAKKVVANTATPGEDEIKLSSVTPYKSAKTLAVNDYVVNVSLSIGAFVDFDSIVGLPVFKVTAIEKDSFSYTDEAPSETNIEIEDSDDYFATIKTDGGKEGFSLSSLNMGQEAFEYLKGYSTNGEWQEEAIKFDLPNQCVEIVTRELGGFPAKKFQWARMSVKASRAGTIGKSGFHNFTLEFTKLANYDASGDEIPGARWKALS